MCHELAQATADPEGSTMDDIVKDADKLVSCLANKAIILQFFLVLLPRYYLWWSSQIFLVLTGCKDF